MLWFKMWHTAVILLLFVGVACAGSPSTVNTEVYISADGGIIASSQHDWNIGGNAIGGDSDFQGGESRHSAISGAGYNVYQRNVTLDASVSNYMDSSTEMESDGGVIYEDSIHAYDNRVAIPPVYSTVTTPSNLTNETNSTNTTQNVTTQTDAGQTPSYQDVSFGAIGMSDMAHYATDQVVDGIDVTTDYKSEGGNGMFTAWTAINTAAGSDPRSPNMDYRNSVKERYTAIGNSTGSYRESIKNRYSDFSKPLGFGDTSSVSNGTASTIDTATMQ